MSSWDSSYLEVVKELDATQRKLRKAEHDRDRYKKRIKFLQGRHEVIIALHRAITKERDILQSTVRLLERPAKRARAVYTSSFAQSRTSCYSRKSTLLT